MKKEILWKTTLTLTWLIRFGKFLGERSNPMYHFTDLGALKSILTNRVLRFTYFEDVHDNLEIHYGIECIQELLSAQRLSWGGSIIQALSDFMKLSTNNLNPYICCFSGETDHLPLWRFYGSDGYGMAIGFD